MANDNNETWKKILHIIITIITALATALTAESCIKHHRPDTVPAVRPTIDVKALAALPADNAADNVQATLYIITREDTIAIPITAATIHKEANYKASSQRNKLQYNARDASAGRVCENAHRPRDTLIGMKS